MSLHYVTHRVLDVLPTDKHVAIAKIWPRVAREAAKDAAVAERVIAEMRSLARQGVVAVTGVIRKGKAVPAYRRCRIPHGWQLPKTVTKVVADNYHTQLAAKYPVVRCVDGQWVRVEEVTHAAA